MKKIAWAFTISSILLVAGCKDYYDVTNDPITYGQTYFKPALKTYKAVYKPGETVKFTLEEELPGNATVAYTHLGEVIKEENMSGNSWTWKAPADDFQGYLVYVYRKDDAEKKPLYSIAVDVSSEWTKFPRYGFVSQYDLMSADAIARNVDNLSRFHINGVQFYDWMHDHQKPLAGSVANPAESWPDLIGRTNYKSTVAGYIQAMHDKGMKTMFYNLLFGALDNAASDGVGENWYLFKDQEHQEKDMHPLDPPFRSSIYLTNPANPDWQTYINKRHQEVYEVFDFDGFHIDQLGNRGTVYDYDGNSIDLAASYGSFIAATVVKFPDKYHVMNSVAQYGQEQSIGPSGVDFLYTEVWDPYNTFDQLTGIIHDNYRFSGYTRNSVLAAYMNYAKSDKAGFIHEPSVLLTNAVIFANGGAHLEVGEHYLANEYFPNNNLRMKGTLKDKLITYYDFMVGYQNLLRDGGEMVVPSVTATDVTLHNGTAVQGGVTVYGRKLANKDVFHFVNFIHATTMEWRDDYGVQAEPNLIQDMEVKIPVTRTVKRVWVASPDQNAGVAQNISVTQQGMEITVKLPQLKYWDMVVVEYE